VNHFTGIYRLCSFVPVLVVAERSNGTLIKDFKSLNQCMSSLVTISPGLLMTSAILLEDWCRSTSSLFNRVPNNLSYLLLMQDDRSTVFAA
jgi:hypothetical protein